MIAAPTRKRMRAAASVCVSSSRSLRWPPMRNAASAGTDMKMFQSADLARNGVLLGDHRGKAVLGACHEQERRRQEDDGHKERRVGDGREREPRVKDGADGAEQQHEASVMHAERIKDVAHEAEDE